MDVQLRGGGFIDVETVEEGWDFRGGPVVKSAPSNAGDVGLIPGRGIKILHASRTKTPNIKQKQYCSKFNKDFKKNLEENHHGGKRVIKKEQFLLSGFSCNS